MLQNQKSYSIHIHLCSDLYNISKMKFYLFNDKDCKYFSRYFW